MSGHEHDAAGRAQLLQSCNQRHRRRIVEAGKRLIEQQQPWCMQQGALEREPLPHPARKSLNDVVRPVAQRGSFKRSRRRRLGVRHAVQSREEQEILARGQLGIKMKIVR